MPVSDLGYAYEIKLGTNLLDTATHHVRQVRVEHVPNAPSAATVVVADLGYQLTASVQVGAALEVSLGDSNGMSKQFVGEIVELALDEQGDAAPELRIDALDKSHRLALGTTVHSFTNQSVSQILSTLAQGVGDVDAPADLGTEVPYLLQAASKMTLFTELVERAGCTWRYDTTLSPPKFKVESPSTLSPGSAVRLGLGAQDLYRFSAQHSGRFLTRATVRGWDVAGSRGFSESVDALQPPDGPFREPLGWGAADVTEAVVTGTPVLDQNEATAVARGIVGRSAARAVTVRATARFNPAIKPGVWVQVDGGAQVPGGAPRSYHVDRVVHSYDTSSGGLTRFEGGDAPLTRVAELAAAGANGSGTGTASLRLDALVIGVVSDNSDPDELGRVKVKFPWLSDEHGSHWARVVSFGAGPGDSGARGTHFMPEIDDEVLVGFENGDLRRPVVIGALFNPGSGVPDWTLSSQKVQTRSITSRKGHVITFSDGDGDDEAFVDVSLSDGKTSLRLAEDRVDLKVPSGNPAAIKVGNSSLTIDDQGNITLKGGKITLDGTEITIKGSQKVEVTMAPGKVSLGTGGSVAVEGTNTEVKGTASLKASGGTVSIN